MSPSAGHAVLTGSSGGIGRAIVDALCAQGWRVTGLDRSEPGSSSTGAVAVPAGAVMDPVRAVAEGGWFTSIAVDVTDPVALDAVLTDLLARFGAPDALIHAAGHLETGPLGTLDAAAGERLWQVHVQAACRLADRLLPAMARAGRGRVVLVGSRVAAGLAGRSQYAACKAALVGLARSWAAEVVADGVTVNVVAPAATRTGMLADPARSGSAPRLPPSGRLVEAAEVASLVAWLTSPAAASVTGQEWVMCGGASLAR